MLSYKFLFFFTDFLEIQRKSFYLFLNRLLSEEFQTIQPLYIRKFYKSLKAEVVPSADRLLKQSPSISFEKKAPVRHVFLSTAKSDQDFSYQTLTNGGQLSQAHRISSTNERRTTIYFLSKNYKFIKPTLNIEESILFSKTYCCHFYMPVQLFDNSTNFTEMRWIFLGTLPLLTRRGHFIINGTPRIILNQIIRSSGIYFHKETTEEKKNSRLFYAEIISKSGPWVRLEIDQKKRIWVSFSQSGITRIALSHFFQNFYQKYLDHYLFLNEKKKKLNFDAILLNEFFWKDVFFKEPKNTIDRNIQVYPNTNLPKSFDKKESKSFYWKLTKLWQNFQQLKIYSDKGQGRLRSPSGGSRSEHLYPLLSSKKYPIFNWNQFIYLKVKLFKNPYNSIQNDKNSKWFIPVVWTQRGNVVSRASWRSEPVSGALLKKNKAARGLGLPNDTQANSSLIRFNFSTGRSPQRTSSGGEPPLGCFAALAASFQRRAATVQSQKSNFWGTDILFASSPKTMDLGLNLGQLGRIRLNKRLGLSLKTLTLTPIDFLAISDILFQLVKKDFVSDVPAVQMIPLDDIDDLKNRRLKTIGELLQNQLARGLQRLQKTFENTVKKDRLKLMNDQTYNSSLSFLNSFNLDRKRRFTCDSGKLGKAPKKLAQGRLRSPSPYTLSSSFLNKSFKKSVVKVKAFTEEKSLDQILKKRCFALLRKPQAPFKSTNFGLVKVSQYPNQLKKYIFEKRDSYLQQIKKINSLKNHTFDDQLKLLTSFISQKQLNYLLTKLHFKRSFLWKELLLYQKNLQTPRAKDALHIGRLRPRSPYDKSSSTFIFSIINSLPINSSFKEFFHSHQLSQYLDQSNSLAEITHKRRLSCLGSGGITRETAGMEIRGIHLSHFGRICPIETPEGKNAGLVNSLTTTVNVNDKGFLETPYVEIYKQHCQSQKKLMFFSVEDQERKNIFLNQKLPKLQNASVGILKPKNFYKFKLNFINLMALNPQQFLSIATTCIPFIEHDDANRALMGSNMQRQALPLIFLEQPMVTTVNAFRILSDLKDIPTISEGGIILYVSQQKISYYVLNFKNKRLVSTDIRSWSGYRYINNWKFQQVKQYSLKSTFFNCFYTEPFLIQKQIYLKINRDCKISKFFSLISRSKFEKNRKIYKFF